MAFDRKYFRVRQAVNGQITRRIWEYDTEDNLAAVEAANYFAGVVAGTVEANMGVEMGDQIDVMVWADIPNANPKPLKGGSDIYKSDAAPSARFTLVVTGVDIDPASANYGDATAEGLPIGA